jgi:predicted negative regulator of RcsB-dependent stress response
MASQLTHKHDVNASIDPTQPVAYVATHKSQVKMIVAGVVGLALVIGAYMLYSNRQAAARGEALSEARKALTSVVSPTPTPGTMNYATEAEQTKAIDTALAKLADGYSSSTEGTMARLYQASRAYDKGEIDKATSLYRQALSDGPSEIGSQAKLALAQVLWGQGKVDEGKKLLNELVSNPTSFVSADQAKLVLARMQMRSAPEEARKLLEGLRDSSSAISAAAVELMGSMAQEQAVAAAPVEPVPQTK